MNFTCPYCQSAQIIQQPQYHNRLNKIYVEEHREGTIALKTEGICCVNPDCQRITLNATLVQVIEYSNGVITPQATLQSWSLLPQGASRPLPNYIPQVIQDDYREACQIADLSPKAAATLIRRCLQGMIRDFCQITKATLFAEISELRKRLDDDAAPKGVSVESIEAIDSIRSIGNIGAHMEKDINVIIPVDADEARLLINLTEMLFDEWYIAKNKREARLNALKELATSKEELRKNLPTPERA